MFFSLEQSIRGSKYWDTSFLTQLAKMFEGAHFTKVQVRLPRNLIPAKEKDLISLDTFLARQRNYPAMILLASNTKAKETIKILFVNVSKETYFVDDTYPSGHSQPTGVYVQTLDPARTHGLHSFFHDFIKNHSTAIPSGLSAVFFAALLIIELLSLFGPGTGVVAGLSNNPLLLALDILIIILSLLTLYAYFASPRGLHIKLRESSLGKMFTLALRGEFRDNPLVSLVFSVLGTIIAAIILRLLGILPS